jgi:DNA-binding transcriptional LysR family regulator
MNKSNWDDYQHFLALATHLHLGLAASHLATSQATVMRRVKQLELQLGEVLFMRRRDGHRLTAFGLKLLDVARETEHLLSTLKKDLSGKQNRAEGHVKITTTEVAANWILLPLIAEFREKWPALQIELDASPQAQNIADDHESIAVRFQRPSKGALTIRKIGSVRFDLYRLKKKRLPQAFEPHIGWAGSFTEIGIAKWLAQQFSGEQPVASFTSMYAQIQACIAGIGVAALPCFIANNYPQLERCPMKTETSPFELDAWLVIPNSIRQMKRIRAAVEFIELAFARYQLKRG